MAAKTNAQRQREYQERLRQMSPMERRAKDTEQAFTYTPEEKALADLIRQRTKEIQERATELNERLRQRAQASNMDPGLQEHLDRFTRIQIPNH